MAVAALSLLPQLMARLRFVRRDVTDAKRLESLPNECSPVPHLAPRTQGHIPDVRQKKGARVDGLPVPVITRRLKVVRVK